MLLQIQIAIYNFAHDILTEISALTVTKASTTQHCIIDEAQVRGEKLENSVLYLISAYRSLHLFAGMVEQFS